MCHTIRILQNTIKLFSYSMIINQEHMRKRQYSELIMQENNVE